MTKNKHINTYIIAITFSFIVAMIIVALPIRASVTIAISAICLLYIIPLTHCNFVKQRMIPFILLAAVLYFILLILWPRYGSIPIAILPVRNPRRLMYGVLLLLSFFVFMTYSKERQRFIDLLANAPVLFSVLACFVGWRFITVLTSSDSLLCVEYWAKEFFGYYCIILVWLIAVRSSQDVVKLLWVAVCGMIILSMLVAVEGFNHQNLYLRLADVDTRDGAYAKYLFDRIRDGKFRAQGSFEHPLLLTEFLSFMVPVVIFFINSSKSIFRKIISLIALCSIFSTAYFVHSRSASMMIACMIVISILVMSLRSFIESKNTFAGIFIGFCVVFMPFAYFVVIPVIKKLVLGSTQIERVSTMTRLLMVERGLPFISKNPIFGIGPGRAAESLGILNSQGTYIIDNYYLQIAMESGVIGLILFLSIWIMAARTVLCKIKSNTNNVEIVIVLTLCCVSILMFKFIMAEPQNFDLLFFALIASIVLTCDTTMHTKNTVIGCKYV